MHSLETARLKQLLKNRMADSAKFAAQTDQSTRYYNNKNDITTKNNGESKIDNHSADSDKGPLRRADYRVSSNFHQILVDQKADYLTSQPPTIDTGDKGLNDQLQQMLGDNFAPTLQELCVDASNSGVAWLHIWEDVKDKSSHKLCYAAIPPEQVLPLYAGDTAHTLLGVCRKYAQIDPDTGKTYTCVEYWDDKTVTAYRTDRGDFEDLHMLQKYVITDVSTDAVIGPTPTIQHHMGGVPFIPFRNGRYEKPDLPKYKGLIDVYDQVYNGFANDLADVQQVILVLSNYGGQDLAQFWDNLRKDKAIKIDNTMPGDKSGIDKLTIDIPVDAREKMLDRTFDAIFVYGEGVNPKQLSNGTALSGVAIKLLYGQLELKASTTETWFRQGVAAMVRMILAHMGVADAATREIKQTWTRSLISNNTERADVVAKLAAVSSKEAVAKNNPIVEDWQQELKDLKKDQDDADERAAAKPDPFANMAALQQTGNQDDGSDNGDDDKSQPDGKKPDDKDKKPPLNDD